MAKEKLKNSNSCNKISTSSTSLHIFISEFDINDTPPSARTLLTKGYVQDEINSFSGATVSTRGRFMTEQEKLRCLNERPLYLFIQGQTKQNVNLAVQKINEIIKTEHQNSLNRQNRFSNVPPPLVSLQAGVSSVEKICVGIENAPPGFDLKGRIIGAGGANLLYIKGETGANITLRGRGSQFTDPAVGTESPEPLHLHIEHSKPEVLQNAKQLAINLIQTIQSELQTFLQQQPPPIQSQQILEQAQIAPAQFQTMNIGALGQPNVVTIQHQDIIQHPQSNVVTLPATILTATVAGATGPGVTTVPPPGVHIPSHSGPLVASAQSQEIQTFIPPPSVEQVRLIGPPSNVNQVQYQIHPGQPLQIQGVQPGSQASPQPVAQMYVMSQPPPQNPAQQSFITSSGVATSGTSGVSYVYAQPNVQRPATPSQGMIEAVNVNLQQPPPSAPLNITQQPPPPLLHLHFPPPNFPPNQTPPPVPQTYQIQYQQIQTPGCQSQPQFILQPGEHLVSSQIQQSHEQSHGVAQHMIPSQFEGPTSQFHLQAPPPPTQTFLVPNTQPQHPQQLPLPTGGEIQHQQHGPPLEQGSLPQPVPPPQIVPPPSVAPMPNSMNVLTNVPPPPTQMPPPQSAPWLYPTQQPRQTHQPQTQLQIQMPPANMTLPNVPPPQVQMQYHHQQMQCQNGQLSTQVQYTLQASPQQMFEQKSDSLEQQKSHGIKRRFTDIEGNQETPPHRTSPLPAQRHGTGEGERQQQVIQSPLPTSADQVSGDRNKLLMPPPHAGEKSDMDQKHSGLKPGNEQASIGEPGIIPGNGPPPLPQAPWQIPHLRTPWGRSRMPKKDETSMMCPRNLPPTNMPPPQIRPRGLVEENRLAPPNVMDYQLNMEYNHTTSNASKSTAYNSNSLVQSICDPPPPPPPFHHQQQFRPQNTVQPAIPHYQMPVSQAYQPPTSWMN